MPRSGLGGLAQGPHKESGSIKGEGRASTKTNRREKTNQQKNGKDWGFEIPHKNSAVPHQIPHRNGKMLWRRIKEENHKKRQNPRTWDRRQVTGDSWKRHREPTIYLIQKSLEG